MRKNYQNEEIDTSQSGVPDTVSVALDELAGELREGQLALAVPDQHGRRPCSCATGPHSGQPTRSAPAT